VLGGVTVILKLPLLVSSAHLATSMAFFLSLIYLAHGLRPAGEAALGGAPAGRALVGAALAFTFVQIVLGALVRHTGTGLACGTGIPLCDGSLWPSGGPAQLQMAHRWAGAALAALIALAAAGPLRDGLHRARRAQAWLSAGAVLLIAVQVGLGLLTVATGISIPVVTAHLGAGALLLADLFLLFLLLAPGRSRVGDTAAGRLAHAHG
jgi:heme A synthase